jgi:VCBS repeat-containing protein
MEGAAMPATCQPILINHIVTCQIISAAIAFKSLGKTGVSNMGNVRGVVAADLAGVVDGSVGFDLAGFAARLKRPAKRPHTVLSSPAVLPFPLMALAACGGGAASAPPPAPVPTVVAPTIATVTPPAVAPGTTTATGNVLPTANQSGAAAATINAVSLPGGASGTVGSALATPLGDFTLNSNGSYSFTVANNDAVKALPGGVSQDIIINFTAGNSGGNTSSSIKLTITGINDAPVATNDSITAPVVITGPITGNVLGNDSDIDRGTTLSVTAITAQVAQVSASLGGTQSGNAVMSAVGTFGSISINSDGSYSYTLDKNDADFIALRGGQTATEAFEYSVSDGAGGTAKAVLNIVVTGVNDAPTVSNASGNVIEDAAINITTGTITIADPDAGQSVSIASVNGTAFAGASKSFNGTYGNLTLNSSGAWTYTLDNSRAATNALAQNAAVTDVFSMTARDAAGVTATSNVTINVTGANDAPVLLGEVLEVRANQLNGSINLLTNDSDSDSGTTLRITSVNAGSVINLGTTGFAGPFFGGGGFSLTSDGNFIYNITTTSGGSAFARLALGEIDTVLSFRYAVNDGFSTTPDISIRSGDPTFAFRIIGVNDAPTVSNGTGAVTEDATSNTATGTLAVSDIDNGQTATIATVNGTAFSGAFTSFNGTYGTLGLNSSGAWTYTLDNSRAATQNLAGGQQVTETFAVTARDPLGATGSGNIVVTVTGAVDSLSVPSGVAINARIMGVTGFLLPLPTGDGTITAKVTGLPNFGSISLANGSALSLNQSLTLDDVRSLRFVTTPNDIGSAGALKLAYSNGVGSPVEQVNSISIFASSNDVVGTIGSDMIESGPSYRRVFGLDGNDIITWSGFSFYTLAGGNGIDTVRDYNRGGPDKFSIIDLAIEGQQPINGDIQGLIFISIENLTALAQTRAKYFGNAADNILIGSQYDDVLVGRGGNDILIGLEGRNSLDGGEGNDVLIGSSSILNGGAGNDLIIIVDEHLSASTASGGSGQDIFIIDGVHDSQLDGKYFSRLTILDFSQSDSDKLDLSGVRDAGGNILDMADLIGHISLDSTGTTIDLSSLKVFGQFVDGTIKLAGFTNILTASDFIFSGGPDWQAMLPPDLIL